MFHFKEPVARTYLCNYTRQVDRRTSLSEVEVAARFKDAFKQTQLSSPNYGLDSFVWWSNVISKTFDVQDNILNRTLYDYYGSKNAYVCHDSTKEILRKLKRHYKLGVLSNCDDRLVQILKQMELLTYFEVVMDSQSANLVKPQQAIFDKFAKQVSCDAKYMLYVGNHYVNDYEAARKAGWSSILLGEQHLTSEAETIRHMSELECKLLS